MAGTKGSACDPVWDLPLGEGGAAKVRAQEPRGSGDARALAWEPGIHQGFTSTDSPQGGKKKNRFSLRLNKSDG